MSLILRWRVPGRAIVTRWTGPDGMAEALARDPELPIAAIVGPPGPPGAAGAPLRIDAASSATWILPHALARAPMVQVFLATGEEVIADVTASATTITVTHAAPQTGFVLVN